MGNEQESLEDYVTEAVKRRVALFDKYNSLPKRRDGILEVEWDDIDTSEARVLGHGSFSCVHQVGLLSVPARKYALKQLNLSSVNGSLKQYKRGAIDIALESRLIACLEHENIIQLHAIKKGCVANSICSRETPFFLVLDHLVETLDDRIKRWRLEENTLTKLKTKVLGHDKKLMLRLEKTAIGIARGMEYLHSLGVLFRDLKPENLGFDSNGVIKIFDFGVARDLVYVDEVKDKLGFTGTPRYMANEVATGKKYGLPADVYSFGILLYEICTLKMPFSHLHNIDAFREKVAVGGERPKLSSVKHASLRALLTQCWNPIPEERPTFSDIRSKLETIIRKQSVDIKQDTDQPFKKGESRFSRSALASFSKNMTSVSSSSIITTRESSDSHQTVLLIGKHKLST